MRRVTTHSPGMYQARGPGFSQQITYSLEIIQDATQARSCGFGSKLDRRPLAPAVVAKLVCRRGQHVIPAEHVDITFFVAMAELWSPDHSAYRTMAMDPSASSMYARRRGVMENEAYAGASSSHSPQGQYMGGQVFNSASHSYPEEYRNQGSYSQSPQNDYFGAGPSQYGQYAPNTSPDYRMQSGPYQYPSSGNFPLVPQTMGSSIQSPHPSFNASHNQYSQTPSYSSRQQGFSGHSEQPPHNISPGAQGGEGGLEVHNLLGPTVTNAVRLYDDHQNLVVLFIFPDLSVRTEGDFCLRVRLANIAAYVPELSDGRNLMQQEAQMLTEAWSRPFHVYPPKAFPGVPDITPLSQALILQGVKISTRKRSAGGPSRGKRGLRSSEDDGEFSDSP